MILPVYLVEVGDFPTWLPSAALALNSVVIVLGQSAFTGRFIVVDRHRMVSRAALLMLLSAGMLALLPAVGTTVALPALAVAVLFFAAGEMAAGPATTALAATAVTGLGPRPVSVAVQPHLGRVRRRGPRTGGRNSSSITAR